MKFQFCFDGEPAAPFRESINHAALDAVKSGFARYEQHEHRIVLDRAAEIRVKKKIDFAKYAS